MLFPPGIRYDNGTLTAEGEVGLRLTEHHIPIPRFSWMVPDDEVRVRFRLSAGGCARAGASSRVRSAGRGLTHGDRAGTALGR